MTYMVKKKSKIGRPRHGADTKVLMSARVDQRLVSALNAMIARTRRSRSVEISIAIEEYLAKEGLWPPNDSVD